MDDHALAADIAREAGELLVELQAQKATKDEGDRLSNDLILARLAAARPDDAILSEESKDSPLRLERERVWIVDPLDGTREWGEARSDWAVHVALAFGGIPKVATVALPGLFGLRMPLYDRVDGLSVPWGPRINLADARVAIDPTVTYRSNLGAYDLSATLRAARCDETPRGARSSHSSVRPRPQDRGRLFER